MKLLAALVVVLCTVASPVLAKPAGKVVTKATKAPATKAPKAKQPAKKLLDPAKLGVAARVAFAQNGAMAMARDIFTGGASPEEEAAAQIQKLLRTQPHLRRGMTGLYVADARTGEPLFAVNAEEAMNPASNVKLISTAAALDLLGPEFRYPTRLLGPMPSGGVIAGDVYLLGSYDPTLTGTDLDDIAASLALRGVKKIEGSIVVGADPTRDGIYRSIIPIDIAAGEPGKPPVATVPAGFDLVEVEVTAKTSKKAHRPKLKYDATVVKNDVGMPRIKLVVSGLLGKNGSTMYSLWTRQRTATAAYSLIAALRARQIEITGEMRVAELGDYVGDAVANGALPVELGRHESQTVSQIVSRVNKWSVNWLSDRLIMTAAALARRQQPSMALALEEMYGWLERHQVAAATTGSLKDRLVIDTGSGLSYRTRITPTDLVAVVRTAAGFGNTSDKRLSETWLKSLAVAGTDGTLRSRFWGTDIRGHVMGKTGSLSTVIALSGVLDVDPQRPLAFALVTNTDKPLAKRIVRRAHEQVIAEICKYLAKTSRTVPVPTPAQQVPVGPLPQTDEPEVDPDAALDQETAGHT